MSSIVGSALAGMRAATTTVAVGASNIANSQTVGTPGATGSTSAYHALDAVQVSGPSNQPEVKVQDRQPFSSLTYQPNNPLASEEGFVETPNVDIATELVNNKLAQRSYEANIKSLMAWDEMQATLLDIKS
ncbi:MAG: flagellar basal body rod C-terminal domain-containing protein [Sneathiella sp.]